MVAGFFLWMKADFSFSYSKGFDYRASFLKKPERNPTAEDNHVERVTLQKIKNEYRPNLAVFENKRAQASLNLVEDRSEENSPREVVRESNFEAKSILKPDKRKKRNDSSEESNSYDTEQP